LCMFFVHIMYFPLFCYVVTHAFVICAIKNYLLSKFSTVFSCR